MEEKSESVRTRVRRTERERERDGREHVKQQVQIISSRRACRSASQPQSLAAAKHQTMAAEEKLHTADNEIKRPPRTSR